MIVKNSSDVWENVKCRFHVFIRRKSLVRWCLICVFGIIKWKGLSAPSFLLFQVPVLFHNPDIKCNMLVIFLYSIQFVWSQKNQDCITRLRSPLWKIIEKKFLTSVKSILQIRNRLQKNKFGVIRKIFSIINKNNLQLVSFGTKRFEWLAKMNIIIKIN